MVNIIVGMHNLNEALEVGRQTIAVNKIITHPLWNPSTTNYDGDIAILLVDEYLSFNSYIQPICMMKSNPEFPRTGTVVGFGKSEAISKDHEEIAKSINLKIHKNEQCYRDFPELAKISSERTICGGNADGSGVCLGDSGSGLYIIHNGKYYLRAIVSASIRGNTYDCDVDKYAIFTDIYKFVDWLNEENI